MKSRFVRGCCAALAVVALLAPALASAQEHRKYGGTGYRGGGGSYSRHNYGGHYSGHSSHRHYGSRSSFGLWIGPGWNSWWWDPWPAPYYRPYVNPYPYYSNPYPYYSNPYRYYEPPAVVTPPPVVAPPPVYEEQVPVPQQGESVWYYCSDPPGYYPYVRQCPKGWTKVAPTPESAQPPAEEAPSPPAPSSDDPVPYEYRWYYCPDPPGYYPYVQDCPKGWTMVAPSPAPAR